MPIELIPPALAGVLGLVAAALSTRLPLPESPMRPTWRRWTAMGMASVLLGVWSGLAVGWPLAVAEAGFTLEHTLTLPAVMWHPVPAGQYMTNGAMVYIEITPPPGGPSAYYRLVQP